ncbi:putative solute carrier family 35 member F1 [Rosellinia necatrix]|uniref:Putative solute carrier family 35 member F1 n=1 Tax=Rosellinia necatrix TaxID=77044 RepID=A0A1W2TGD0_ROSNE|nr:putative solute carrier family 35 member F1 [Rosellinia necatrix]
MKHFDPVNSLIQSLRGLVEGIGDSSRRQGYNPVQQIEMGAHVPPSPARKSGEGSDSLGNTVEVRAVGSNDAGRTSINRDYGTTSSPAGGQDGSGAAAADNEAVGQALQALEGGGKVRWYSYLTTRDFWIVLVIGQVLALAITTTNTFSSLLVAHKTSIPAFQSFFNYVLLTVIYLSYTLYQYGFKKFGRILWRDWWRYLILSFFDVEGNYFTVLAYNYTNILSAQLINFWAIVVVVIISFVLLRVRYKVFQIVGILICVGGTGILLASDHIQGTNGGPGANLVKGDLFALLGATFYGLTNTFEEWFVSRRPAYEVLAFIGLFGLLINGTQAAIFDRHSLETAEFTGPVIGYIVGFTLALTLFYSVVPFILRLASAAFFNISLLTGNFWGAIIGVRVFGYAVHFLYPVAFVLIILGQLTYFLAGSMLGDARKPWLGEAQEDGVAGFGTAKLKAINAARRREQERLTNGGRESQPGIQQV